MIEDPKKRPDDDSLEDDPAQASPEDKDDLNDESASVLFFGDRLENLVQGEKVSNANISSEPEEVEKTPMDSPSALFFGESLENAAEREAKEETEEEADADEGADTSDASDPESEEGR